MKWTFHKADIFDEQVDVLVCSANVQLNLSGGVGGELLLRYGGNVQKQLHAAIAGRTPRFAEPGEVFCSQCSGSPYISVLHAVAVDSFYKSSSVLVEKTVDAALKKAGEYGASRVALAALATGYGCLSMQSFASGVFPLHGREYPPIAEAVVCVDSDTGYHELVLAWEGLMNEKSRQVGTGVR